jgi:hypothetical protein
LYTFCYNDPSNCCDISGREGSRKGRIKPGRIAKGTLVGGTAVAAGGAYACSTAGRQACKNAKDATLRAKERYDATGDLAHLDLWKKAEQHQMKVCIGAVKGVFNFLGEVIRGASPIGVVE